MGREPLALGLVEHLAAPAPHPRPPPPPGLDRIRGVRHVDDQEDAVVEALGDRRHVRIAAAEPHDPVHARAGRVEVSDPAQLERVRYVVDDEPVAESLAAAEALLVHEQQTARELHLVGVRSCRRRDLGDHVRVGRVGDVQHRGAHAGAAEMADVEGVAVAHDLHAVALGVEIGVAEEPEPRCLPRRDRVLSHRRAPKRSASQSEIAGRTIGSFSPCTRSASGKIIAAVVERCFSMPSSIRP